jgi:hypothetical protein
LTAPLNFLGRGMDDADDPDGPHQLWLKNLFKKGR